MRRALLDRISEALGELDLGISEHAIKRDPLKSLNRALRLVGGARLRNLDAPALRRAANTLEGAIDDTVSP